MQHLVSSLSVSGRPVHRTATEIDDTSWSLSKITIKLYYTETYLYIPGNNGIVFI